MHLTIIAGSHRPNSQSSKVATYLQQELARLTKKSDNQRLQKHVTDIQTDIIDLRNNPLPLWNDYMRDDSNPQKKETITIREPYQKILTQTDGLIIIAPERAGMAPTGLKNFLLYCSGQQLANKPALLVGISAGIGGTYPLTELRISSNKNSHFFYIPQHLILRNIKDILNTAPDQTQDLTDRETRIRHRINYSLQHLVAYAHTSQTIRNSGLTDLNAYPYGM